MSKNGEPWRDATPAAAAADVPEEGAPEFVIKPTSGWIAIDWREIYNYRELLAFFIWRDVSARYKQTILGPAWAIIQPLIMMVIFTFMARLANLPTPMNLPYSVCVFAALIPWSIFSQGMPASSFSLIQSLHMVTKVYFPRLFLPVTAASVFLVDALITLCIYGGILLYYHITPQWTVVFVPVLLLLTLIATLSIGVLLSGLTLFYRDFRHIVPFLMQIMMFVTPIYFTIELFDSKPRWIPLVLSLNPMFGIVDAFRSCILGTPMYWGCFLISSTTAIVVFVFSIYYFQRTERLFADYV